MSGNDPSVRRHNSTAAFKVGTISLIFLIIGYEAALFVHRAASLRAQERRDRPDTVYVIDSAVAGRLLAGSTWGRSAFTDDGGPYADGSPGPPPAGIAVRRNAYHEEDVNRARMKCRKVENFRFDPNTVSVEDLMRLGFSEKQALSIDSYRSKGGRFRRKGDFARSYVVADSVFKRLEPYIHIPKTDINLADSAAFDALPGIGPYFAVKMLEYRDRLGGYSYPEQLMDIWNFDEEKYRALEDLITCSEPQRPFELWTLDAYGLKAHPYVKDWQTARSIVLWRENTPREEWTAANLCAAHILDDLDAARLLRCRIRDP